MWVVLMASSKENLASSILYVVLRLDCASESAGRLVNIQIAGPHPQSFGLLSSEMRPENLHVKAPAGADASGLRERMLAG